jgi:hypothetical protein
VTLSQGVESALRGFSCVGCFFAVLFAMFLFYRLVQAARRFKG